MRWRFYFYFFSFKLRRKFIGSTAIAPNGYGFTSVCFLPLKKIKTKKTNCVKADVTGSTVLIDKS